MHREQYERVSRAGAKCRLCILGALWVGLLSACAEGASPGNLDPRVQMDASPATASDASVAADSALAQNDGATFPQPDASAWDAQVADSSIALPDAAAGTDAGATLALSAGAAVVDITPTVSELAAGKLYLGGFGSPITSMRPASGSEHPIEARALALDAGGQALLVVVLDVPGMSNRVIKAIVDRAQQKTGVAREAIWVSATHSHAGPDLQGLWGGVPSAYKQRVIAAASDALASAYEARAPARLRVGRGEHAAKNRRDWDEVDRELYLLEAVDAKGKPIGALVNFASHPTLLPASNLKVSGDYCYFVRRRVSQALAGAPVLFLNGVLGDVLPAQEGTGLAAAETYGNSVADAALAARAGSVAVGDGLRVTHEAWVQDVTNLSFLAAAAVGLLDYDLLRDGLFTRVNTQVALAGLGKEVQILAFPGESLTRNGRSIKATMKAPYRLFLGLTTDSLGYFVPGDEWGSERNGGYEEGVSLDRNAGDNAKSHAIHLIEVDNANVP